MATETFELDTLRMLLTVVDEGAEQPKSLEHAQVEAVVKRTGGIAFAAYSSIIGPSQGRIMIEFAPETFEVAEYLIQVRVTDEIGDTQTVYNSTITAARSLRVGEGPAPE
jgi:hypothetical protein